MIVILSFLTGTVIFLGATAFFEGWERNHFKETLNTAIRGEPRQPGMVAVLKKKLTRRKRAEEVERDLPDFFDLLALGLSSGFNFEKAFERATRTLSDGFLKQELFRVQKTLRHGGSLEKSFSDLSAAFHSRLTAGTFSLILQSLRQGSPLQEILFDQAATLRRARMLTLEKRAQTVGLRLLFPIVVFIFPTIFILLFGMLYLSFIKNGSLF